MNILRKNTIPKFEIIPRENLNVSGEFTVNIISEFSQKKQTISATVILLENENYLIEMTSFPIGKEGEKFSYTILDANTKIVSLGKFIIVSEFESIQDYSKKKNTKFYN